jgi:nitrite reductase (NADH) small subunit
MSDAILSHLVVNLGSVDKIQTGHGLCFIVDGVGADREEVAVFRQRDGRIFALQNRCPHRHGPLAEGIIGSGQLVCPLHAHTFDLQTGQGPKHECLKTYEISVQNGELLLKVPLDSFHRQIPDCAQA